MAVKINFTPPSIYNLSQYQLGQSATQAGALTVVASGTEIGSFPEWIDSISWSGGTSFYYAVRFVTDESSNTAWSARSHGRYGHAGFSYFIHYPSGDALYIIPQASGVGASGIKSWLSYNTEYTIAIESSGLYGSGMAHMEQDYVFSFTAEYCPVFSTPDSVRMMVGPMIDGIPDDTIYRMIQKTSLDFLTRFYNQTNPFGCNYTTVPEPVYRWVTCATGLHALNAASAGGGAGVGNTSKRLGSFAVTYDGGTDVISPGDVRKSLNDCMAEAGNLISALNGKSVQYGVQSISNTHLLHPLADVAWGRQPRKLKNNGTTGPWKDATRDYKMYDDASSPDGLDTTKGFVSGTYFL